MINKDDGFPYADPATPGSFAHKQNAQTQMLIVAWRARADMLSRRAAKQREPDVYMAVAEELRDCANMLEGVSLPAPTYDAQPPGLTVLAPKRPVE